MGFVKEFREFALKGSVIDLAIGIMLGAAFALVVASFTTDILSPPIGLLLGDNELADKHWVLRDGDPAGPYQDTAEAAEAGAVVLSYGNFVNTLLTFLITVFVLFLIVKQVNRMRKRAEKAADAATKTCTYCASTIPVAATRCPLCTSELGE